MFGGNILIAFSGPDLSGKSTLIRIVSEKLDVPVYQHIAFKNKREWRKKVDFMGKVEYELLSKIDFAKTNLLVDRFLPDTIIYPRIFKRKVDISYINVSKDFSKNVALVYVRADWDIIEKRYKERKDRFIKLKELKKLYDAYEEYFKAPPILTFKIDTSSRTPEDCARDLLSKLNYFNNIKKKRD